MRMRLGAKQACAGRRPREGLRGVAHRFARGVQKVWSCAVRGGACAMPGMVLFGRRWAIASDDLVFPGFFELFLRVLW